MPEIEPVTRMKTSIRPEKPLGLFGRLNCEQIDYRYPVTRDKFDIPRFLKFFGKDSEDQTPGGVTCRTVDPDNLDYHIHFYWQFGKQGATFYVSYHSEALPESEDEREPYAEGFMPWFGSFFAEKTAHSDLHSEFRYPERTRQSRFPPLKVNISDDLEAQIDGVTLSFASMPGGVDRAEVRQLKKHLVIDLMGETRTNFAEFDIQSEVAGLSSFALRLTKPAEDMK